jgi:hypothetical protein
MSTESGSLGKCGLQQPKNQHSYENVRKDESFGFDTIPDESPGSRAVYEAAGGKRFLRSQIARSRASGLETLKADHSRY